MKRSIRILIGALTAYLLLLVLLLAAENRVQGSSIRTFGDALWFSLVTMTTVGYGDLTPVTPMGRLLGLVFAIFSLGILAAVIGLGLHLLSDQMLPRLRLRRRRKQPWYVFTEGNAASLAFARDLRRKKDGAVFVFPSGTTDELFGREMICLDTSPEELLRLRGGHPDGLVLLRFGENSWKNCSDALAVSRLGLRQYCLGEKLQQSTPQELSFFDPCEALARLFWRDHPLLRSQRCIVLIGCGPTGRAILERALLTNVFEPDRRLEYHIFEDMTGFDALHPKLYETLQREDGDRLVFHKEAWNGDPDLLARADRILLCREKDCDNFALYRELTTWFPLAGEIYLRLSEALPGLPTFGSLTETITAEAVFREDLDRWAMTIHDLYSHGSSAPLTWPQLSPFLRQSNIAAADHLPVKLRTLLGDDAPHVPDPGSCRLAYERYLEQLPEKRDYFQEIEHRRWLRFHLLYNWIYDPVRDNERRMHPMLLPYCELTEEERRKDAYAWELLGKI